MFSIPFPMLYNWSIPKTRTLLYISILVGETTCAPKGSTATLMIHAEGW